MQVWYGASIRWQYGEDTHNSHVRVKANADDVEAAIVAVKAKFAESNPRATDFKIVWIGIV